ncbi:MAG: hypothetical protein K0S75_1135 [Clostridia bacterium]|jgi:hypothetical protein|nr:hypothetical protein [Clostridia bacterium]
MYFKERFIFAIVWMTCLISLWFIPKNKFREATFIFLFTQLPAWILGLAVVEADLIEYPVREFHKANGTNFSFEYFVLPFICIFFNLYYPNGKSHYKKLVYGISIIGIFTLVEYIAEKYTLILKYIHWEWYHTFLSMYIVIYLVRAVYKWFFKLKNPLSP